ncbi:MAG: ABC transporter ATP-binding protein [Thermoplasmata archaeon]
MIEVRDLKKSYGDFQALKGVSLKVLPGTVYVLLGSNGAGKTTLIKILTGLLRASSGAAFIDNISVWDDVKGRDRFGYMPEHPHLYDRLTGREFLDIMGSLRKLDAEFLNSKIEVLAQELELDKVIDSEINSYSKGMKQKILFANSLINDPPNLILDEPTSGLDPRFTRYIKKRIREEASAGKSILMSTHITSITEDIADRVAIIEEGNIAAQGDISELYNRYQCDTLEDVFVEVVNYVRSNY